MKVKVGDKVKVLSGKDRGKTGKVVAVLTKEGKLVVSKINYVKKHKKQTRDQKDPGGIIQVEAPIGRSKVMVICPACEKGTRIGFSIEKGSKKRTCKKCKAKID
ncbi:MAG: 50S ribosomal protein L24 [Candidatus Dojkabacteria bacterium]|nr:50S ribosomal protein L24 [Candidatus Dojkabacteria bacterium]